MAESFPSTSATTATISAPVTTAEDYFDDDLDDVIINFVPDELVQSIINGTDPNLNFIHTEVGASDDSNKKVPKIVLKLTSKDVESQSTELWKKAITSLQEDKSYFIGTEETVSKRKKTLLNLSSSLTELHGSNLKIILKLYTMIELSLPTTSLISEGRRLMWQSFYGYLGSDESKVDFIHLKEISTVLNFDILVYKLTSKLLELLITANIELYISESESSSTSTSAAKEREKMDDREQNIVNYVAGFIAHSTKKFYNRKGCEGEQFIQAINKWSTGKKAKCFEFKSKWVDLRNRGGLVNVNDNCFLFFRAIEYSVRDVFNPVTLNNYAGENLKEIIKERIYKRKYVIYRWDELMKGDELDSIEKESLFKLVVVRWIDIRGKAFVRAWVDGLRQKYKDKVSDKGEHSHRKQLNAKRNSKSKSQSK